MSDINRSAVEEGILGRHLEGLRRVMVGEDGNVRLLPSNPEPASGFRDPEASDMRAVFRSAFVKDGGERIPLRLIRPERGPAPEGGFKAVGPLYAYVGNLATDVPCKLDHQIYTQDLGMAITRREAELLYNLGVLNAGQLCFKGAADASGMGYYQITSDTNTLRRVANALAEEGFSDPRLEPDRRDDIITALANLPSMKAEGQQQESLKQQDRGIDVSESFLPWTIAGVLIGALVGAISILYTRYFIKVVKSTNERVEARLDKLEGGHKVENPLEHFGRNLVEEARQGLLDPYVGGEGKLQTLLQSVASRDMPNGGIHGKPGVGKTVTVEALAQRIASGELKDNWLRKMPHLSTAELWLVNLRAMTAGTRYRGDFEERLNDLMEQVKGMRREGRNVWLVFDEAHLIMTAGAAENSPGASQQMKTDMQTSKIPMIFLTTTKEKEIVDADQPFSERIAWNRLEEPTVEETIRILEGKKGVYERHHRVKIAPDVVEAIVRNAPVERGPGGAPYANPRRSMKFMDRLLTDLTMSDPDVRSVQVDHVLEFARRQGASNGADPAAAMEALLRSAGYDPDMMLERDRAVLEARVQRGMNSGLDLREAVRSAVLDGISDRASGKRVDALKSRMKSREKAMRPRSMDRLRRARRRIRWKGGIVMDGVQRRRMNPMQPRVDAISIGSALAAASGRAPLRVMGPQLARGAANMMPAPAFV